MGAPTLAPLTIGAAIALTSWVNPTSILGGGGSALLLLQRASPKVLRLLAFMAVTAVVLGWGVAQYPYMLGTHLSVDAAAAPRPGLEETEGGALWANCCLILRVFQSAGAWISLPASQLGMQRRRLECD